VRPVLGIGRELEPPQAFEQQRLRVVGIVRVRDLQRLGVGDAGCLDGDLAGILCVPAEKPRLRAVALMRYHAALTGQRQFLTAHVGVPLSLTTRSTAAASGS
jgi:hypothetical protein